MVRVQNETKNWNKNRLSKHQYFPPVEWNTFLSIAECMRVTRKTVLNEKNKNDIPRFDVTLPYEQLR